MFVENIFPSIVLDFNTSKNLLDYVSAFGPSLAAFAAAGIAFWQVCISKKQKEINEQQFNINQQQLEFNKQQIEIQRCNFIYSGLIKEKQEKLLELRNRFLAFKDINMLFLSILFPCAIMDKKQNPGLPPRDPIDIDEEDSYVSHYIDSQEIPTDLIENARKVNLEFYQFLENNKIFLNDNPRLYLYLQKISYGFSEFFKEFITEKTLYTGFYVLINYIYNNVNIHSSFTYTSSIMIRLKNIRQYFYGITKYYFCIDENGENTHIFYKNPYDIFSLKKLQYDENKWSESNKIAFFTHAIFTKYFNAWRNDIDKFFSIAFTGMQQIQNYDKK